MQALAEPPTATRPAAHGGEPSWRSPDDRQAAARAAFRAAQDRGETLTGAQLGPQFGMSERWGRDRIAEVRDRARTQRRGPSPTSSGDHAEGPPPSTANGDGSRTRQTNGSPAQLNGNSNGSGRVHPPTNGNGNGKSLAVNGNGSRHPEPRPLPLPAATGDDAKGATSSRSRLDWCITIVVGLVAGAASARHLFEVALMAGEPLWMARAFPVTVDGLLLASLRSGQRGRGWLTIVTVVSVAANVLSRYPEVVEAVAPAVSAWPPLAMFATHSLLHGRAQNGDGARHTTDSTEGK